MQLKSPKQFHCSDYTITPHNHLVDVGIEAANFFCFLDFKLYLFVVFYGCYDFNTQHHACLG